jgi:hypothetical protein
MKFELQEHIPQFSAGFEVQTYRWTYRLQAPRKRRRFNWDKFAGLVVAASVSTSGWILTGLAISRTLR